MKDFEIHRLGSDDVQDFRYIRLAALRQSPEMFGSTYEIEAEKPIESFTNRLDGATVLGAYDGQFCFGTAFYCMFHFTLFFL